MSDLTASNCGCNTCGNNGFFGRNGCEGLIFLILIFSCFGGGSGFGFRNDCDNNNCCNLIWLILIFCCFGNGFSGFNGCGCGC